MILFPKSTEEKLSLSCAVVFCYQIITLAINHIFFPVVGYGFIWDTICILGVFLFYFLRPIKHAIRRLTIDSIFLIGSISCFIGLTFIGIDTSSIQYAFLWRYIPYFFGICAPTYIIFRAIRKPDELIKLFRPVGLTICISAIIIVIVKYKFDMKTDTYNMVFGYNALIGILLLTDDLFVRFRLSLAIMIIVTLAIILVYGSRGPILCFAVFLILKLTFSRKIRLQKKVFYATIITATATLTVSLWTDLALTIIEFANQFGFSARTLSYIVNHKITEGRFFDKLVEASNEIDLMGLGIAGDTNIFGMYSHNIVFEVLFSFGYLFGTILLGYFLFFTIYGILFSKNENYHRLCKVLFCCSFVKLLFTGSFIGEYLFYAFLAISTASFVFDQKPKFLRFRNGSTYLVH